ncbi:MAG: hypothetical protein VKP62_04830 [Candidatus Sericytochromatia bacterium]|nr:hypothetical protein [Candidatus Sericytochromatia bacterium]
MHAPPTLEVERARALAAQVRSAYDAAVAGGWRTELRVRLLDQTLLAVGAYLVEAPEDANGLVYHALLLDLLAPVAAEDLARMEAELLRCARVSATLCLSKEKQRGKAQSLLKRLDLVQNPQLQIRERLLHALSLRTRDLPPAARQPGHAWFPAYVLLRRATRLLAGLPLAEPDTSEAERVLAQLAALGEALDAGDLREQANQFALLRALHGLEGAAMPPEISDACLRGLQGLPSVDEPEDRATRDAVFQLLVQLEGYRSSVAEAAALLHLLGQVPAMVRKMVALPEGERDAAVFTLRHRLAAPDAIDLEAQLEKPLAALARLTQRRDAAFARLARAEAQTPAEAAIASDHKVELAALRTRWRRIGLLRDALLSTNLTHATPEAQARVEADCAALEGLAADPTGGEDAFLAQLTEVRRRLEAPVAAERSWHRLASECLKLMSHEEASFTDVPVAGQALRRASNAKARVLIERLLLAGLSPDHEAAWLPCLARLQAALQGEPEAMPLPQVVGELMTLPLA